MQQELNSWRECMDLWKEGVTKTGDISLDTLFVKAGGGCASAVKEDVERFMEFLNELYTKSKTKTENFLKELRVGPGEFEGSYLSLDPDYYFVTTLKSHMGGGDIRSERLNKMGDLLRQIFTTAAREKNTNSEVYNHMYHLLVAVFKRAIEVYNRRRFRERYEKRLLESRGK